MSTRRGCSPPHCAQDAAAVLAALPRRPPRPAAATSRLRVHRWEPETLLVAETAALRLDVPPPDGAELVPVVDAAGVDALVAVHG